MQTQLDCTLQKEIIVETIVEVCLIVIVSLFIRSVKEGFGIKNVVSV